MTTVAPTMKAMLLEAARTPLVLREVPMPSPSANEVLIAVEACGVCRTDQHIADGELPPPPHLPLILGHEVVGRVVRVGERVQSLAIGDRVGVPWLGKTCGSCDYCSKGRENLCDAPEFTGYTRNGGYAEYVVADARYCFRLPESCEPASSAPLLCAGLIGYRAYRLAGTDVVRLGLYGFGASAHILAQLATAQGREVYAFVRRGDEAGVAFARSLGCVWAGWSDELPPEPLDAAIIFAPVGALVPRALQAVRKGGRVVCAGIYMSDIPAFPYRILWEEREIRSVANLERRDGTEFFEAMAGVAIRTHVETFPLAQANEALDRLREGRLTGAAVLIP
ncbi:MAG: alcohol dehydrogenase [Candidatus Sumerlaea sp.]|uniref:alcohol dehydrogenase n=1 Tax=Sumerlaea chitinivorans TaxID=2250252 RepID=A0A2Z4Y1L6_SUMC1|nr:Alcohol dehydrogenase [Candidatus Sumerlaea chitinivorans]MCX7962915.1 zinc-dependent alcohol dehydrogenase family protein [Candidatus Sumerlaea chitinivorans]GIX44807.1 MAG: alcohol dehydrogenase [Candidatus Sumerlaea sp.]